MCTVNTTLSAQWASEVGFNLLFGTLSWCIVMVLTELQPINCEIRFGICGLQNPSLIKKFYPEDLPEDWRLTYYSNEFNLILLQLSDLGCHLSAVEDALLIPECSVESLSATISELQEEIAGEKFSIVLDLSEFPEDSAQAILKHKSACAENAVDKLYFVNLKETTVENPPKYSTSLNWVRALDSGIDVNCDFLTCYVSDKQTIEPIELKKLIAGIQEQALFKGVERVNVIFSSEQDAFGNCRTAILLESMM